MVDAIVQWFTANLSGFMAKEVIVFIISMIPILDIAFDPYYGEEERQVYCKRLYKRK